MNPAIKRFFLIGVIIVSAFSLWPSIIHAQTDPAEVRARENCAGLPPGASTKGNPLRAISMWCEELNRSNTNEARKSELYSLINTFTEPIKTLAEICQDKKYEDDPDLHTGRNLCEKIMDLLAPKPGLLTAAPSPAINMEDLENQNKFLDWGDQVLERVIAQERGEGNEERANDLQKIKDDVFAITPSSLAFPIAQTARFEADYECSDLIHLFTNTGGCAIQLFNGLGNVGVTILGWILSVVNGIFNQVFAWSVNDFSRLGDSDGVRLAWGIMRDIANIVFLFILIYIGVGTILQLGGGGAKRTLTTVIVAALLVNFSFFLTGIVIDASNVAANYFHNILFSAENKTDLFFKVIKGLDTTNLIQFQGSLDSANFTQRTITAGGALANLIGSIAMTMVAIFVIFSAAILFALRIVALVFLLVFSPLAFAAYVLPSTAKHASQWWNTLLSQSFLAPIFLLAILVPIKVADVIVATRSARTAGTVGFANTAADFVILIGLLLAALSVARSLSGNTAGIIKRSALLVGGAFLTYTGIKAAGSGIKAAGGLGLREHFGRRAFRKKESKEFKEFEASWPRMGEFFGDKLSKIAGAKFGGKQGYEEKIKKQADKIKDFRGDPELQATYLRTLGADAKARAMEQLSSREKANLQDHINLPKDSVAYRAAEAELQNRGVSSANISAKINTLRDNRQTRLNIDDLVGKLPVEEKEKIIKARREAEKQAGEEASRKIAENTIASLKPSRVMYNRLLAPDATINAEAKDDLRSVLTKIKGDQIKKLAEVIDVASPQNKAVTIEILNGLGRNKISELAKYFDEKQLIGIKDIVNNPAVEIQQPSGNTTKHQLNQETIEYIKHGPQNTAFGFYDKAAGWRSNAPPIHPSGWLVQKDLRGNWFAVNPNNSGQQETFDPNTKMWS